MPAILAFRRLRQEDWESQIRLNYIMRFCLLSRKKKETRGEREGKRGLRGWKEGKEGDYGCRLISRVLSSIHKTLGLIPSTQEIRHTLAHTCNSRIQETKTGGS